MFSIQCEDLMMLRFSNTKLSMLYNLLSVGKAPWVELDKLFDKTTVQGFKCESRSKCSFTLTIQTKGTKKKHNRVLTIDACGQALMPHYLR